ncbi:MAG TPA: hypothetical protein VMW12_08330 [Candidatus Dormibacteraeota bacterium]|nr:hypothetical protein [Candidatus Dormibacteraeota bacterium]
MRTALYCTAGLAALAVLPLGAARSVLAGTAAILLEAAPFLCIGSLLGRIAARRDAVAFAGCGCGRGPSARSIPATLATGVLFGPFVAAARFIAATFIARRIALRPAAHGHAHESGLLDELLALLPAAVLAALVAQAAPFIALNKLTPAIQLLCGVALGFFASPCALGAVAFAAALRVQSSLAAWAYLAIAGIFDVHAFRARKRMSQCGHDPTAYVLLACAFAIVAARRGDALVHPLFAAPFVATALVAMYAAWMHRRSHSARARIVPALVLAASVLAAPAPQYRATETTMAQLFPGERLAFTGTLVRHARNDALVRYAITCCRADAQPVAVRLSQPLPYAAGTWIHAEGRIVRRDDQLVLVPLTSRAIPPPTDPFVYR